MWTHVDSCGLAPSWHARGRLALTATLKDNAVKQQIERHNELVRSAMRAVRSLER